MNEIINSMSIALSVISLLIMIKSLRRTIIAYKKHEKAREKLKESKNSEHVKLDEILNVQKEIIEILNDSDYSMDFKMEILEKGKEELEKNYHKLEQLNNRNKIKS